MIFAHFPLERKKEKYGLVYKRQLFAPGLAGPRFTALPIPWKLERLGVGLAVARNKGGKGNVQLPGGVGRAPLAKLGDLL